MNLESLDLGRLESLACLAQVEYFPSLTSTNDRARLLADDSGVRLPALIAADEQTAGRGRGANRWWTGAGSLAVSILLDPSDKSIARRDTPLVSLAAAAAAVEVLALRLPGRRVGLHWPNDIFVAERKIGGILTEGLPGGRLVMGIGLNVNNTLAGAPAELLPIATTLRDLTGMHHDRTDLLVDFVEAFDAALAQLGRTPEAVAQRCDALCLQHGQTLCLDTGKARITGVCRGVAPDGALILDTEAGPQKFYGGVLRGSS